MNPRILALATHYTPAFAAGGAVRSIENLVKSTESEFDWKIITSDRDLGSPEPYSDIKKNCWTPIGQTNVRYLSPYQANLGNWLRILKDTPHDLLYLNSLFSPGFSIQPLMAARGMKATRAPLLLAPRGEAAPDAVKIKAWKKVPYLWLTRQLYRDVQWHASTILEAADIRALLGVAPGRIHVARDLLCFSDEETRPQRPTGSLRVCFLSRVARIKNLEFVIRVVAALKTSVTLSIFGPREDIAYWHECEALLEALPAWVTVNLSGAVPTERVRETLATQDVLFVPSRGENFGHVFPEAWAAGIPVLVSDRTPWRNLADEGVGWDFPLDDPAPFIAALEILAQLPEEAWQALTGRCLNHAKKLAADPDVRASNVRMFREILDKHRHNS
jgi:glycosyltransferase involved in cell wall biosynthesis